MDNIEFNKTLQECLINCGFILKNKNYYNSTDDLIVVVSAQKSNYDNSYYINYAFLVKKLHMDVVYPKTNIGDVGGRFEYKSNNGKLYYYPLSGLEKEELQDSIKDNIDAVLKPVIEDGLMKYFDMFPNARFAVTKKLQQYLKNID